MESLLWHLTNQTAETEFIFNLFHLLLAGLALVVLLRQLRDNWSESIGSAYRLLPLGFFLLVLHFAVLTAHFGAGFFLRKEWGWTGFESFSHGLMGCGLLLIVAGFLEGRREQKTRLAQWSLHACVLVAGLALINTLLSLGRFDSGKLVESAAILAIDLLVMVAIVYGIRAVLRGEDEGRRVSAFALASVGISLLLHSAPHFLPRQTGILVWNAEQHGLSISLFAFAWATGERSGNLLERVFVRLNLTFIILASLIMLITAGMEKYQYLRLAEERSMNLAEFLRGHIVYYQARGEGLEGIFRHQEVLRRVVVEFGTLPELREVNVYLDGQRASFHHARDWEIEEKIESLAGSAETNTAPANSFQMIRLPVGNRMRSADRIEFVGTLDYLNAYIGKYIILIYFLFTIMVGLASGVIGIIVTDADRQLRQQYQELQETHHQLAQAAKVASVGQLAGGMAHEINTPITSILSLASYLADGKGGAELAPRQRENLQVIAEQAKRVAKIVRNLLTFARQSHLELSRVDVGELLDTAITLVQYRLRDSGTRLSREIDADLPPILGDADRLTEVFVNLVNNAIDAMPSGGTLVVRAYRNLQPSGGVRVEVKDTGSGIPPDQLPRIFDPFFTTKEPGRGTGLGLSISHGIVKDHGGQIWAESRPDAGTTLVVTLPKEVS